MAPPTDPLAIVSIVLGMLSLITCACCGIFGLPIPIAAAICGGTSLSRQRNDPDRFSEASKPMAIAGLVLGAILLLISILTFGSGLLRNWDVITSGM